MGVPYTFSTASQTIPLAQLDANFATPVTIGSTTVALGQTVTTLANVTLTNPTFSGGNTSYGNITYTGTLTGGTGVVNYGSGQFYKDASGNVGIGTTSPSALLHINGTTFIPALIQSSASTTDLYFKDANTTGYGPYVGSAGNSLAFGRVGVGEYARIDATGNVGIGTTSPSYSLDIRTTTNQGLRVTDGTYSGTFVASSLGGMAITTGGAYSLFTYVNGAARTSVNLNGHFTVGNNGVAIVSNLEPFVQVVNNFAGGQFICGQTGSTFWQFGRDNVTTGYFVFGYNGTILSTINSSTGVYTAISDARLKKNITPITYGLKEVLQLNPVMYNMKTEADTKKKHIGLIAQEVKVVMDELVEDIDETKQNYGLSATELVPVLIKAIQELNAKIQTLEAKIGYSNNI
jgi:hypothetical protein